MTLSPQNQGRTRYAWLGVLLVISVAFQTAIWVETFSNLAKEPSILAAVSRPANIVALMLHVVTPSICLLLGFYVAWVRIEDRRAWLLLAVLISFSINADGADFPDHVMRWSSSWKHLALVYRCIGLRSWPVWMMIFAIYFPERAPFDVRRPSLKWAFLVPSIIGCAAAVLLRIAANEDLESLLHGLQPLSVLPTVFYWLTLAVVLPILLAKARNAPDSDSHRRLRVLFAGLAISLIPAFIVDGLSIYVFRISEDTLPGWIQIPAFSALALFPVTLAYVTVVQRALDVPVLIRQSLQYALAKRGLIFLQAALSLVVIVSVAVVSGEASLPVRIAVTTVGVAAILCVGLGARRLADWIDRRFFREAYRTENVLRRLADSVRSIVELEPLLETVTARIAEALHVSQMAVFLQKNDVYQPAFALGHPGASPASFHESSALVRSLQAHRRPLPVYFEDRRSWLGELNDPDIAGLRALKTQLLLPLARRDQLLGFVSLGSKASEAPYSVNDLDLLNSVASQTALAVENSRLTEAVATQTAERQVLSSELAIAREVQQRLLPQVLPKIAGIELAAFCRPAREVGGDYYDFLELNDGAFGIAIGDVSGKGVPAALLMASLQATLRGQTASGRYEIGRLLKNISRAIYSSSSSNKYATFFYAHYQPDIRRLTYVNAGHNAPILLRCNANEEVVRLEATGPPIGLLPDCEYLSGQLDLREGDLLLLYTDGISEAMNSADEEWGEEHLIEIGRQLSQASSSVVLEKVFAAADEFAGNAPQHDDMTLMVVRFAVC